MYRLLEDRTLLQSFANKVKGVKQVYNDGRVSFYQSVLSFPYNHSLVQGLH